MGLKKRPTPKAPQKLEMATPDSDHHSLNSSLLTLPKTNSSPPPNRPKLPQKEAGSFPFASIFKGRKVFFLLLSGSVVLFWLYFLINPLYDWVHFFEPSPKNKQPLKIPMKPTFFCFRDLGGGLFTAGNGKWRKDMPSRNRNKKAT